MPASGPASATAAMAMLQRMAPRHRRAGACRRRHARLSGTAAAPGACAVDGQARHVDPRLVSLADREAVVLAYPTSVRDGDGDLRRNAQMCPVEDRSEVERWGGDASALGLLAALARSRDGHRA